MTAAVEAQAITGELDKNGWWPREETRFDERQDSVKMLLLLGGRPACGFEIRASRQGYLQIDGIDVPDRKSAYEVMGEKVKACIRAQLYYPDGRGVRFFDWPS